ncbi:insulinase family protein [Mesorhizobium sp. B2-8-1]|nr:insulinase family protein [Mesorhizobium sp. B2-8-1]TPJ52082.1 insulinase family protein [Mesorhizobium sp. B2-6-4]TPK38501.1 insulinase family protein [Mesorhizobium sp. B2-5-3]TPK56458.1 insulinase family protein [Mesorhizobium sp. B2-5-2]TPK64205.1 insulinase family protein [Mesorhizobium sp. B2-5-1]TPL16289.1 insulinase family protein [Mesorhizobium sp. B2-4-10]TPL28343.1 insulinase family protein [Mesorhizobium sp. B2-4-9]TPL29868.1 insulinase family protein [Mesorhizobium sp. B2-4-7
MMKSEQHGSFPSPKRGEGRARAALVTLLLSIFFLVLPALAARAMDIQQVTSPKGVTAWLVEDYSVPMVAIRFVFGGGSTQDPPGKEGLANLMTGLFDEGAGPLDSDAFQVKLDDAGAEMSFEETRDGIYGSMRMLAEQRDEAFDLLRLAVNEPRFDQAPIDRIGAQILSGIIAGENDPDTIAQDRWARALYGDHPYSRSDQGTRQSIAAITRDDLKALHKAVFARSGLHVAVVGAIDPETLKKKLDMVFGGLPQNQALAPVADVEPNLARHIEVDYDLPQTSLQLAWPGVKRKAADFFPAVLMNEILGGGTFTSRLFQEVREKRGLAYSVNSSLINQDHADALIVTTGTRSDRAAETLGIVRDVVKRLAEDGPTDAELAATKKYMIGAYAINNLDSSSAIAATLVELQLDDLGVDYIQRRTGLINAVTLDQVKAAAKKLLSAEPTIMVVGPPLAGANKG